MNDLVNSKKSELYTDILIRCEEIIDIISRPGFDSLEEAIRKTDFIAKLNGNNRVRVWLYNELNGITHKSVLIQLGYSEKEINLGVLIWQSWRMMSTYEDRARLSDKMHSLGEMGVDSNSIASEMMKLPKEIIQTNNISELIKTANNIPESGNIGTDRLMYELWRKELFCHQDAVGILTKLKNNINIYVIDVYSEVLDKSKRDATLIDDIRNENEVLKHGLLKNRVRRLFNWMKKHKKVIIPISGLLGILGAIVSILGYFGITFEEITKWLKSFWHGLSL